MAGGAELEELSHELEQGGGAAARPPRRCWRRRCTSSASTGVGPRTTVTVARLAAGQLPGLLGGLVRRRPAADPLGAVPRRARRGRLRVAGAGPVRLPADRPGPAHRRAGAARACGSPAARCTATAACTGPATGRRSWPRPAQVAELTAAVGGRHVVFVPVPGLPGRRHRRLPGAGTARRRRWRRWCARPTSSAGSSPRSTACGCSSTTTPTATWRPGRRSSGCSPRPTRGSSSLCLDTGHLAYGGRGQRRAHRRPPGPDRLRAHQADGPGDRRPGRAGGPRLRPGGRDGRQLRAAGGPAGRPVGGRGAVRSWTPTLFVVVEQDMYPVDFDVPAPIAAPHPRRTCAASASATETGGGRMTVRVGVIGVGMIGQDHIRRLTRVLSGVRRRRGDRRGRRPGRRRSRPALRGARVHATGEELIADRGGGRGGRLLVGPDPRAVRARRDRRRQAGLLREAAGHHPGGLPAHPRPRRPRPGGRLVQVGYMRRYDAAYRALQARSSHSGDDRRAAADALRAPQPERAAATTSKEIGDHRHRGARDRHGAVAVRRGDRRRPRC